MSLARFHPAVRRWFSETLGTPTAAQCQGWEAIREGRAALIAAPTGSGKTLAAFLGALDDLFQEGLRAPLPDEVRVVYVSPLKALSADIHKNLAEPRQGIRRIAEAMGLDAPRVTAAVRTGDTTSSERASMLRTPPHILVTTPESLYLLLTAERSRAMLRTARTVIVDEIHAVIGTRRGAHLALSLERLQRVAEQPLVRIGLSATQKPIEEVAKYLMGARAASPAGARAAGSRLDATADEPSADRRASGPRSECAIIDSGHRRAMDLGLEMPRSPLEAVMSAEVWEEYYDRLAALVGAHRTTLVFVNTRKMAERVARHLADRLGDDAVTAHHGSLSKEKRLDAEHRLKRGELKALVATASLELGIDIGHVDLVCQIGSPHRIATFLQRVGRSGHTIAGTPKGRIFPLSRDDLFECAALLRSVRQGELDRIVVHDAPLDVLAQQIVAEASCEEYAEDELFDLVRSAWPYRALERRAFDEVVTMLAEGFATRRGRRAALVHRDEVHRRVRGRRGSRMLAITSGGAIPEIADYRVLLEPDDTFIGTLNEDFAIESNVGDIFQLGNMSWQVLQVASGTVRVADAKGAPPTIPFWVGEAPARSDELSHAVSQLRSDLDRLLSSELRVPSAELEDDKPGTRNPEPGTPIDWLVAESGIPLDAAREIVAYLAESRRILGVLPTQETLVLERFFDESGGMQLVLHAPFGSRVNKAWGLALRKRFCRQFNFELQAAATEDAILLSLGPQHSFPLADVFRYLHPATARDILVQAFLAAPMFPTRWRWNTTIALAVPRSRGGKKMPPQLQRTLADDLMAAVFPDAAACPENLAGDIELPDHPLVNQVVRDCLEEAMDFDALTAILGRVHAGEIACVARDTVEPSPLAHEILNAKPYAFLDDAPLEERRTQAVQARRATEVSSAGDLGALDAAAIARVRDESRPDPRDADELHDALLTAGFLTEEEASSIAPELFDALVAARRAERVVLSHAVAPWIAAERLPEFLAIHPVESTIAPPPSRASRAWTREEALVELFRGRLAIVGPATASVLAESIGIEEREAEQALLALEAEGAVLRGWFTGGGTRSLDSPSLREGSLGMTPGSGADSLLMREPTQRELGHPEERRRRDEGSQDARSSHFEILPPRFARGQDDRESRDVAAQPRMTPALEWCDRRLLARIHRYTLHRLRAEIEPVTAADFMRFLLEWQHLTAKLAGIDGLQSIVRQLDGFAIATAAWERAIFPSRMERYEPALLDMLCLTGQAGWVVSEGSTAIVLRENADAWQTLRESRPAVLSDSAQRVLETLRARGALFARDLGEGAGEALDELMAAGLVTADGFAPLRKETAGRWSLIEPAAMSREAAVEVQARAFLRRYGVVFRRLLAREPNAAPWRELTRVYRRLEARGEIRGGRFVTGMSGEQFALPDAVTRLRQIRREGGDGRVVVINAADPLNLVGILDAGERVRAIAANRIAYRDGVAVSVMEGDYLRPLVAIDDASAADVAAALAGRRVPVSRGFVGRPAHA